MPREQKRTKTEPVRKGPQLPCVVTGASVDWITCTASQSSAGGPLWDVGAAILAENDRVGERPKPWQMKGYRGWATGGARVGVRQQSCLLSLSSYECSQNWLQAFVASENCSRLDVAVDTDFDPPVTGLARHLYRKVVHNSPMRGRPISSRLIEGSDGGSTLYLGSRASERFARLYDKGVEQQTTVPGKWYRWEVEFKGETAKRVGQLLSSSATPTSSMLNIVATHFHKHVGVAPISFDVTGIYNPPAIKSSIDKKLLWLRSQVRPTIQTLLDAGRVREVLSALGLPPQSAVE